MKESSAGLDFEHRISHETIAWPQRLAVALLLVFVLLSASTSSAQAADHITIDHARFAIGAVYPKTQIIPADVPGPYELIPNASGVGSVQVDIDNSNANVALENFRLPTVALPVPGQPSETWPVTFEVPDGLFGSFYGGEQSFLMLGGTLRIKIYTGIDRGATPPEPRYCQIDQFVTFTSGLNAVMPGVSFGDSLTNHGALAASWSDLPDGVSRNGGSCDLANAVIHDSGGLWLSQGLVTPPDPPVCAPPTVGTWPDCVPVDNPGPPSNDDFVSAKVFPDDASTVWGTTKDATIEAHEPNHGVDSASGSVWYSWTPSQSGEAVLTTCPDFPSDNFGLAVYTGTSLEGLAPRASGACTARFSVSAGTTYRIAVVSRADKQGEFGLSKSMRIPPANDAFQDAQALAGSSVAVSGTTFNATLEPGEPPTQLKGDRVGSAWFNWTAPSTGVADLNACGNGHSVIGSDVDAVAVYKGATLSNLSEQILSGCAVSFAATSGVTYRVAIISESYASDRWNSTLGGPFDLTLDLSNQERPTNDDFAQAETLDPPDDAETTVGGTTANATLQPGEPAARNGRVGTVWYKLVAKNTGTARLDACPPEEDPDYWANRHISLVVYAGPTLSNLVQKNINRGSCMTSFRVISGSTYYIALGSGAGRGSEFTFKIDTFESPINDDSSNAIHLDGEHINVTGTTKGATDQISDPADRELWYADQDEGSGSVWYSWTPAHSGAAYISTATLPNNGATHAIEVLKGSSPASLVMHRADANNYLIFRAVAGTKYWISVGMTVRYWGSFRLELDLYQPPLNDSFSQAINLTGSPVAVNARTLGASQEAGEPDYPVEETGTDDSMKKSSVWYRWTAPRSGEATVEACGEIDGADDLGVYSGSNLESLTRVSYSSSYCRERFEVTSGSSYWIRVQSIWVSAKKAIPVRVELPSGPGNRRMDIALEGDGRGQVKSESTGIDCGVDCSEDFATGSVVNLTATASPGSLFSGWSGACSGASSTCEVAMSEARSVTASFVRDVSVPNEFKLTVARSGGGQGKVSSSPAGVDCGSDCSEIYVEGTTVTLTAAADAGSEFSGWTGACSGSSASCHVTMNQARNVTAKFATDPVPPAYFNLTLNRSGDGQGRVTSTPSGIDCGTDCTRNYVEGITVTLTATADSGSSFSGWSGACSGSGATCQVTMNQARNVTAAFADLTPPLARFELTVTKSGDGQGRVTSTPVGIDCGSDCSESYTDGTTVTLTAVADSGSSFTGWSGACTGTGSCEVRMSQVRSVTASFLIEVAPPPPPKEARVGKITAASKGKVQRGKTVTIEVKVKNTGGKTLQGKLQIKSSNTQVKVPRSAGLNVKPGKTQTIKVKVKATKKAKGKASITFRAGGKKAVTTLAVKK